MPQVAVITGHHRIGLALATALAPRDGASSSTPATAPVSKRHGTDHRHRRRRRTSVARAAM